MAIPDARSRESLRQCAAKGLRFYGRAPENLFVVGIANEFPVRFGARRRKTEPPSQRARAERGTKRMKRHRCTLRHPHGS